MTALKASRETTKAFDSRPEQGYSPAMGKWYVYLLRCSDETLYCGITTDPGRRVDEHNSGTGAKYTRSRRPVVLVETATVETRGDALRLEMAVKRQPRHKKIDFLRRIYTG
ncbi:GIY-YIG nuclease family protein [Salidesulfovibrio brasiliensis]|uniref:GIY-YIG nuclease family protein n=1 Tax=Salidesulfovibrio brasiliensis TaxID=221711 RepID=UPI000A8E8A93